MTFCKSNGQIKDQMKLSSLNAEAPYGSDRFKQLLEDLELLIWPKQTQTLKNSKLTNSLFCLSDIISRGQIELELIKLERRRIEVLILISIFRHTSTHSSKYLSARIISQSISKTDPYQIHSILSDLLSLSLGIVPPCLALPLAAINPSSAYEASAASLCPGASAKEIKANILKLHMSAEVPLAVRSTALDIVGHIIPSFTSLCGYLIPHVLLATEKIQHKSSDVLTAYVALSSLLRCVDACGISSNGIANETLSVCLTAINSKASPIIEVGFNLLAILTTKYPMSAASGINHLVKLCLSHASSEDRGVRNAVNLALSCCLHANIVLKQGDTTGEGDSILNTSLQGIGLWRVLGSPLCMFVDPKTEESLSVLEAVPKSNHPERHMPTDVPSTLAWLASQIANPSSHYLQTQSALEGFQEQKSRLQRSASASQGLETSRYTSAQWKFCNNGHQYNRGVPAALYRETLTHTFITFCQLGKLIQPNTLVAVMNLVLCIPLVATEVSDPRRESKEAMTDFVSQLSSPEKLHKLKTKLEGASLVGQPLLVATTLESKLDLMRGRSLTLEVLHISRCCLFLGQSLTKRLALSEVSLLTLLEKCLIPSLTLGVGTMTSQIYRCDQIKINPVFLYLTLQLLKDTCLYVQSSLHLLQQLPTEHLIKCIANHFMLPMVSTLSFRQSYLSHEIRIEAVMVLRISSVYDYTKVFDTACLLLHLVSSSLQEVSAITIDIAKKDVGVVQDALCRLSGYTVGFVAGMLSARSLGAGVSRYLDDEILQLIESLCQVESSNENQSRICAPQVVASCKMCAAILLHGLLQCSPFLWATRVLNRFFSVFKVFMGKKFVDHLRELSDFETSGEASRCFLHLPVHTHQNCTGQFHGDGLNSLFSQQAIVLNTAASGFAAEDPSSSNGPIRIKSSYDEFNLTDELLVVNWGECGSCLIPRLLRSFSLRHFSCLVQFFNSLFQLLFAFQAFSGFLKRHSTSAVSSYCSPSQEKVLGVFISNVTQLVSYLPHPSVVLAQPPTSKEQCYRLFDLSLKCSPTNHPDSDNNVTSATSFAMIANTYGDTCVGHNVSRGHVLIALRSSIYDALVDSPASVFSRGSLHFLNGVADDLSRPSSNPCGTLAAEIEAFSPFLSDIGKLSATSESDFPMEMPFSPHLEHLLQGHIDLNVCGEQTLNTERGRNLMDLEGSVTNCSWADTLSKEGASCSGVTTNMLTNILSGQHLKNTSKFLQVTEAVWRISAIKAFGLLMCEPSINEATRLTIFQHLLRTLQHPPCGPFSTKAPLKKSSSGSKFFGKNAFHAKFQTPLPWTEGPWMLPSTSSHRGTEVKSTNLPAPFDYFLDSELYHESSNVQVTILLAIRLFLLSLLHRSLKFEEKDSKLNNCVRPNSRDLQIEKKSSSSLVTHMSSPLSATSISSAESANNSSPATVVVISSPSSPHGIYSPAAASLSELEYESLNNLLREACALGSPVTRFLAAECYGIIGALAWHSNNGARLTSLSQMIARWTETYSVPTRCLVGICIGALCRYSFVQREGDPKTKLQGDDISQSFLLRVSPPSFNVLQNELSLTASYSIDLSLGQRGSHAVAKKVSDACIKGSGSVDITSQKSTTRSIEQDFWSRVCWTMIKLMSQNPTPLIFVWTASGMSVMIEALQSSLVPIVEDLIAAVKVALLSPNIVQDSVVSTLSQVIFEIASKVVLPDAKNLLENSSVAGISALQYGNSLDAVTPSGHPALANDMQAIASKKAETICNKLMALWITNCMHVEKSAYLSDTNRELKKKLGTKNSNTVEEMEARSDFFAKNLMHYLHASPFLKVLNAEAWNLLTLSLIVQEIPQFIVARLSDNADPMTQLLARCVNSNATIRSLAFSITYKLLKHGYCFPYAQMQNQIVQDQAVESESNAIRRSLSDCHQLPIESSQPNCQFLFEQFLMTLLDSEVHLQTNRILSRTILLHFLQIAHVCCEKVLKFLSHCIHPKIFAWDIVQSSNKAVTQMNQDYEEATGQRLTHPHLIDIDIDNDVNQIDEDNGDNWTVPDNKRRPAILQSVHPKGQTGLMGVGQNIVTAINKIHQSVDPFKLTHFGKVSKKFKLKSAKEKSSSKLKRLQAMGVGLKHLDPNLDLLHCPMRLLNFTSVRHFSVKTRAFALKSLRLIICHLVFGNSTIPEMDTTHSVNQLFYDEIQSLLSPLILLSHAMVFCNEQILKTEAIRLLYVIVHIFINSKWDAAAIQQNIASHPLFPFEIHLSNCLRKILTSVVDFNISSIKRNDQQKSQEVIQHPEALSLIPVAVMLEKAIVISTQLILSGILSDQDRLISLVFKILSSFTAQFLKSEGEECLIDVIQSYSFWRSEDHTSSFFLCLCQSAVQIMSDERTNRLLDDYQKRLTAVSILVLFHDFVTFETIHHLGQHQNVDVKEVSSSPTISQQLSLSRDNFQLSGSIGKRYTCCRRYLAIGLACVIASHDRLLSQLPPHLLNKKNHDQKLYADDDNTGGLESFLALVITWSISQLSQTLVQEFEAFQIQEHHTSVEINNVLKTKSLEEWKSYIRIICCEKFVCMPSITFQNFQIEWSGRTLSTLASMMQLANLKFKSLIDKIQSKKDVESDLRIIFYDEVVFPFHATVQFLRATISQRVWLTYSLVEINTYFQICAQITNNMSDAVKSYLQISTPACQTSTYCNLITSTLDLFIELGVFLSDSSNEIEPNKEVPHGHSVPSSNRIEVITTKKQNVENAGLYRRLEDYFFIWIQLGEKKCFPLSLVLTLKEEPQTLPPLFLNWKLFCGNLVVQRKGRDFLLQVLYCLIKADSDILQGIKEDESVPLGDHVLSMAIFVPLLSQILTNWDDDRPTNQIQSQLHSLLNFDFLSSINRSHSEEGKTCIDAKKKTETPISIGASSSQINIQRISALEKYLVALITTLHTIKEKVNEGFEEVQQKKKAHSDFFFENNRSHCGINVLVFYEISRLIERLFLQLASILPEGGQYIVEKTKEAALKFLKDLMAVLAILIPHLAEAMVSDIFQMCAELDTDILETDRHVQERSNLGKFLFELSMEHKDHFRSALSSLSPQNLSDGSPEVNQRKKMIKSSIEVLVRRHVAELPSLHAQMSPTRTTPKQSVNKVQLKTKF